MSILRNEFLPFQFRSAGNIYYTAEFQHNITVVILKQHNNLLPRLIVVETLELLRYVCTLYIYKLAPYTYLCICIYE